MSNGEMQELAKNLNTLTKMHIDAEQRAEQLAGHVEALTNVVQAHEQERVRFYRAMRAALESYLGNEDGAK